MGRRRKFEMLYDVTIRTVVLAEDKNEAVQKAIDNADCIVPLTGVMKSEVVAEPVEDYEEYVVEIPDEDS
jgi:hypothetical protein